MAIDFNHDDFWWQRVTHAYGGNPADIAIYLKMLNIFCETGAIAGRGVAWSEDEPWREYDDPMLKYLTQLMSDPEIKVKVLSSRLSANVFMATVGRFIVDCIHYQAFLSQSQHVEAGQMSACEDMGTNTPDERRAWQKLITQIGEKHEDDGFDTLFFRRMFQGEVGKQQVDKLLDDWANAISEHLRKKEEEYVSSRGETLMKNIAAVLGNAEKAVNRENVSDEQAVQAWRLMNGQWTESEFLRNLNTVRLQNRYPQLKQLADRMGRTADSMGHDRLTVAEGQLMKISHSSGSDITGITTGADLDSLLPTELAMYADSQLEDIFYYRYTRHRLQTFDYKSRMTKPSRRLSFQHARRLGPMIVCIDTSASMFGPPQRIIKSMLSLLEEMAERLKRDCYLIDFSVGVKAIDLRLRMKRQFYKSIGLKKDEAQFDKGQIPFIGGGTDAHNMLEATFQLLESNVNYVNADVLWISDFLIPLPERSFLSKIKDYRRMDTRFYGLSIRPTGENGNQWAPMFDNIYNVEYRIVRRY